MRLYLPERRSILLLLAAIPCLMSAASLTMPPGEAVEGDSEKKVEQWIEDLGSERFENRDAATRALMNLEDEPPSLRKSLKSPDLEIRLRVANILESYVPKRARRGLSRAQTLAWQWRADEMVERLVLWREWHPKQEEWRAVADIAVRLVEWEHRTFGNTRFLAGGFSPNVPSAYRRENLSPEDAITPKELADMWTGSSHRLGREIVLTQREVERMHLVILASEKVQTPFIYGSVLISGGSIHMEHGPSHSVIICDDDLELSSGFDNCLVIVRGKVICRKDSKITNSLILSGGPVVFSENVSVENAAILSGGPIVCQKGVSLGKRAILKSILPNFPVRFFGIDTAGLTVWQAYRNNGARRHAPPPLAFPDNINFHDIHAEPDLGAGVEIKEIRRKNPFALGLFVAGLRTGDVITAIDENKTPTKEVFRKVLRRKLAEGRPLTFTVQRAGKTLEVPIAVKD